MELITTPFGFESTAADVIEGIDLSNKRAVVTGASSGIGVETARALAGAGAAVTMAVRDTEAGEQAAEDIDGDVRVARLDLTDRETIDEFVDEWDGALHILVNNAGVMAIQELERTDDGWEMQFATNHLGHFALTAGLYDALGAAGDARVVSVSSAAHLRSPVVFDDINFESRPYDPLDAYGQSKTANVLFAVGVTKRWGDEGITSNALMPGAIPTNLQRHMDPDYLDRARSQSGGGPQFKTVEQGAATSVLLATSPLLEGIGGRYFEDCNEAEEHREGSRGGVAPYAVDHGAADRLWDLSLRWLDR
jgi:NAD(P)-dependent dehydrogenase (short-subunit alcohol dehydrogenase family)